ncbi:glycosyltransferase family 2 protein [Achromobacter deleyi]|uniref:glycosyltransferase family 2 protein n=1 Tax=Achromobacter deleyi TaxID=1353891 RepID=UPI0014913933|nr:glycosyltransferase family 2 protein [Achromobacter deleyi]QVQ29251.1 glycosyltransferase family 2 protein [Achromobacter deleyi]UIP19372.1 glycosyltransferase family 2 protein [Achromobacter deleyi]
MRDSYQVVTTPPRTSDALVSIVVPFYNESETISFFYETITRVLPEMGIRRYELVCVNDGSKDDTLLKLVALSKLDERVRVVDLSRNFGKEAALTAGVDESVGDVVVPMDCDLQDPPQLIGVMLNRWQQGFDVVLAKRSDRSSDGYLKRVTAAMFYRVHNKLSDTSIPENVGDFRLMDRRVVDALKLMPERRRFMKGLFAWVGFKSTVVEYVREQRVAGTTKFSGIKLVNFAIEGITSFSTAPLRLTTYMGLLTSAAAFLYAMYIIVRTLVHGADLPGYSSMLTVILFLGGVQLISVGIVGEYVGRIYMESKQRPIYIIQDRYQNDPA